MKMKRPQPIRERDITTLWKNLREAAYAPLLVLLFFLAAYGAKAYKDQHWIGVLVEVLVLLIAALFASRWTCAIIDELRERHEEFEQHGGRISSKGAPSAPPNESSP